MGQKDRKNRKTIKQEAKERSPGVLRGPFFIWGRMERMEERKERILKEAEELIGELFAGDSSGHDREHTLRVYAMARKLAEREGADLFLTGVAALLHDVDDHKLSPGTCEKKERARRFLRERGVDPQEEERIITIIHEVSYKGTDSVRPSTIEGRVVQDADRLDAIGAIGIARAFAFGGAHGRKLYDPMEKPEEEMGWEEYKRHGSTTINHFYEKLLRLEGMMNTGYAKELARGRQAFMEEFLERFYREWEGKA